MADEKKSQAELIAQAVKEAMVEALPQAVAIAQKISHPEQSEGAKAAQAAAIQHRVDTIEKCQDCGQRVSACKRQHRKMVVFPSQYGEWFQGVFVNGVRYLSSSPNHQIDVPAEAPIENLMSNWEESERVLRTGRAASHNSGTLGGGGGGFNQASSGWR